MKAAISPIRTTAGDLRTKVDAYLTNGKYDPRKSQNRADDLKNARLTVEKRQRVGNERRALVFANFDKLVTGIVAPSNEEHYHSLRRPPEKRRHSAYDNRRNLRVPSALFQTNKLQKESEAKAGEVRVGRPTVAQKRVGDKRHTTYSSNARPQTFTH